MRMGHGCVECPLTASSSLSSFEGFTLIDVATAEKTLLRELTWIFFTAAKKGLTGPRMGTPHLDPCQLLQGFSSAR